MGGGGGGSSAGQQQYDYAVPALVMAAGSGGKCQYGGGSGGKGQYGGGSSGSNHYASNTILKPAYYEPLNARRCQLAESNSRPANLSFDSDYKTPLDSGSNARR